MIGPEDDGLRPIVPVRDGPQHALQLRIFRNVAAGEQSELAEAQRAAQYAAPVDLIDELAVLAKEALVDALLRPELGVLFSSGRNYSNRWRTSISYASITRARDRQ